MLHHHPASHLRRALWRPYKNSVFVWIGSYRFTALSCHTGTSRQRFANRHRKPRRFWEIERNAKSTRSAKRDCSHILCFLCLFVLFAAAVVQGDFVMAAVLIQGEGIAASCCARL